MNKLLLGQICYSKRFDVNFAERDRSIQYLFSFMREII